MRYVAPRSWWQVKKKLFSTGLAICALSGCRIFLIFTAEPFSAEISLVERRLVYNDSVGGDWQYSATANEVALTIGETYRFDNVQRI